MVVGKFSTKMIIFLILATILPVKCLYIERQIGVETDINGKHDEVFDDSILPSLNARKKDDFGWRRNLDNEELPLAVQNSVKGKIAELRRSIRRGALIKGSKAAGTNTLLLEGVPQKADSVGRQTAQQKFKRPFKRRTLQKTKDLGERQSARKYEVFPTLRESRENLAEVEGNVSKDWFITHNYTIPSDVPDKNILVGIRSEHTKDPLEELLKDQNDDSSPKEKNSIKSSEHSNKLSDLAFDLELDPEDAMNYAIPIDVKVKGYLEIPEKDD